MALFFINVFTGEAEGDFHRLRVRDGSGNMTDILTLIGSAGQFISSVATPLAVTNGQLSINLNSYVLATDLTNTLANYVLTSTLNSSLANYTLTSSLFNGVNVGSGLLAIAGNGTLALSLTGAESRIALKLADSNGTVRDLTVNTGGALLWNSGQVALISDLSAYQQTLSATAPISIVNNAVSIDLSAYSTTAQITTLLASKQDTLTFNTPLSESGNTVSIDLSSYSTTAQINSLLAAKQDNISVTGQGVFLNGSVLNGYDLRWNTSNTPTAPIHCLRFEDLSVVQNLNLSSGQLELQVSASNKQDNISVTLPLTLTGSTIDTLWKPSNLSVSTGLGATSNDSAGTSFLFLTGTESRAALKLQDSNSVIKDLTHNTSGRLVWDGDTVETSSTLSPQLALKQNTLSYYSESTANTNPGQYQYGPTNTPVWVNPYFTNNGSASQDITYQVFLSLGGTTLNQAYMWSLDLKSNNNTTPEILVTVGDTTTYNYGKIFQLNDSWKTIQLPWFGMSTNAANLHLGYNAPPLGLTQPGGIGIQVQLRNFAIYEVGSSPNVAISQQLSCASDVRIAGSIINTSDKRLKTAVETLDPAIAMSILQSVEPKTYERTDGQPGRRAGFLADDIMMACLDNELYVGNIVTRTGNGQYLGLDYARLSSLLWSCCKTLDAKCNDLESRISALEKQ